MNKPLLFAGFSLIFVAVAALTITTPRTNVPQEVAFSSPVIDIGVVASDLDRSLQFYEEVVGMTRSRSFDLDETFGRRSGLTDARPVRIEVLTLGDAEDATEFKLMSFGDAASQQSNDFIHDHTGVQYVTLHVAALNPVIERIRANDVETLGETPIALGGGNHFVLIQDPDGTFVELIGPLEAE